jgi:hypothetical protein
MPTWNNVDVDPFIQSDLVCDPRLKLTRQAAKIAIIGSVIFCETKKCMAYKVWKI